MFRFHQDSSVQYNEVETGTKYSINEIMEGMNEEFLSSIIFKIDYNPNNTIQKETRSRYELSESIKSDSFHFVHLKV